MSFSAEDIRMHKLAFTWPEMILPILSGAEQRLQKEHEAAESHLDKWLKEYTERLVALAKAVREFNTKATMGDAETYVAELEDIQKRLLAAIDEVRRALSLLTRINLIEVTFHEVANSNFSCGNIILIESGNQFRRGIARKRRTDSLLPTARDRSCEGPFRQTLDDISKIPQILREMDAWPVARGASPNISSRYSIHKFIS